MQFAILGPLAIRSHGHDVDIARPQRRAVLGYLLSRPNRAVSTTELIDAVWGDSPPKTVRSQVHAAVSGLRSSLSSAGLECLRSGPAGYTLHADDEQLDAARFRRHLARARDLAERGAGPKAARELRSGLALWRGDVLAGVEAPFVWALRASAEEERFTACETLADIEIQQGRHQEVVPELTGWLERFPTRESIAERLVVALCRSGRQADALEVIRRLRAALADVLGVDLGPGLAELQTRVLAMDPDLFGLGDRFPEPRRPAYPGPAPNHTPPAQLPPDPEVFVGRRAELAALTEHLVPGRGGTPVAVVFGMAGVGKTTLAAYFGHRVAADYPDGQIYLNLSGGGASAPVSALDALTVLLISLGVPPESVPGDVDTASALLRSTLRTVRVLVVLDDAASAAQVRPLLPAATDCAVVIASRSPLAALDGVVRVPLTPLGAAEGRELLAAIIGEERVAADEAAAAELVDVCGGLPLALRAASARLLARPARTVRSVLDQLRMGDTGLLNRLDYDDLSVRRSLDLAYLPLAESTYPEDRTAALALRRMGALRITQYGVPFVGHLLGTDDATAESALERLADLALVEETGHGRFALHELVYDYVDELIAAHGDPTERCRVQARALRWSGVEDRAAYLMWC